MGEPNGFDGCSEAKSGKATPKNREKYGDDFHFSGVGEGIDKAGLTLGLLWEQTQLHQHPEEFLAACLEVGRSLRDIEHVGLHFFESRVIAKSHRLALLLDNGGVISI